MKFVFVLLLVTASTAVGRGHGSKQPLTIILASDNPTFKAGSVVSIEVTLVNSSGHSLKLGGGFNDDTGLDMGNLFEVRDGLGNVVTMKKPESRLPISARPLFRTLGPGERFTEQQDITRLYDLSRPGKYAIQVSRAIPVDLGKGTIKSNIVTITVTK